MKQKYRRCSCSNNMDLCTKNDVANILILVSIALVLGIYLIATTVVISRDGMMYIEQSIKLSSHFTELVKGTPPIGFHMLIAGFRRVYLSIFKATDPESWIISAQACVLTCKILAIPVLYFFGACFFNRNHVFPSLLVLTFLPYPTQFGADILRDWPYVLFLFSAMLFLVEGIRQSNPFLLVLAGLTSGLGHIIRPECGQVLLYGLTIFAVNLFRSLIKKTEFRKKHLYFFLLAGFLVVFVPYSLVRGTVLPEKIEALLSVNNSSDQVEGIFAASLSDAKVLDTSRELVKRISENLHYYFFIPAILGLYLRFIRKSRSFDDKDLFMGLFISFNCLMLFCLHFQWGYVSKRHALPLCILLSFYIPSGITAIATHITTKTDAKNWNVKKWGRVLILVGILTCLPKLLSPIRQDKRIYLDAANWIEKHTVSDDRFLTFDARIPFYGKRQNWELYDKDKGILHNSRPDYLLCPTKNGKLQTNIPAHYALVEVFEDTQKENGIQVFQRLE